MGLQQITLSITQTLSQSITSCLAAGSPNLTLDRYKTAAGISHKVLETVSSELSPSALSPTPQLTGTAGWCVGGSTILSLCEKGDKLLEDEISKVYKGKKIAKGIATPTTISPSSHVTPFTPLVSDTEDSHLTIHAGDLVKIQLGAQIDGFGAIVCHTIVVPEKKGETPEIKGREADVLLATYYANELLLRLMVPPGLLASGTEEERRKATSEKAPTQSKIISLVEKVAKAYGVQVVQHTLHGSSSGMRLKARRRLSCRRRIAQRARGRRRWEMYGVWRSA